MWKWVKNLLLKDIDAKSIPGKSFEYFDILTNVFGDEKQVESISNDLLYHIITNDFIINPAQLIVIYKNNYNFTVNELYILLYKIGLISRVYIDNPNLLITDALKSKHIFSKEQVSLLKTLENDFKETVPVVKPEENILLNKVKNDIAITNSEADELIDQWLIKFNKVKREDKLKNK